MESHQGRTLGIHPWIVNPGYTTSPVITMYWVIQWKLLVGIEPRMSESAAHLRSPTN